jgi:UrcA family protein
MTMRKTILITATLFTAISAIPASAQGPATQSVSYAGLDLGTPAGRAALNRRVASAVEAVCGSYAGASGYETGEIDRCRAAARTGIETQLAALRSRGARLALGSR